MHHRRHHHQHDDIHWTQVTLPVKDGGLGIRSVTVLTPSAVLASAAGKLLIQNDILHIRLHIQVDSSKVGTVNAWKKLTESDVPTEAKQEKQKEWDDLVAKKIAKTSRQRKRSSGSSAFAGSCSATFWRLECDAINHRSGTTNDERDHQDRHRNDTRYQHLRALSLPL